MGGRQEGEEEGGRTGDMIVVRRKHGMRTRRGDLRLFSTFTAEEGGAGQQGGGWRSEEWQGGRVAG